MPTSIGPQSAGSNSGAGWLTRDNAHANGGGSATCVATATSASWGSYNFSGLPSSGTLIISGIAVRLDAFYPIFVGDPLDAATLTVDLSWDNGTTWTSTKVTAQLTDTEVTYTLGNSSDAWGHTWTRAELQSGTFLVRVKTSGTFVVGGDTWNLDWVPVTVYYQNRLEGDAGSAGVGAALAVGFAGIVLAVAAAHGPATAQATAGTISSAVAQSAGASTADARPRVPINLYFVEPLPILDSITVSNDQYTQGGGPTFAEATKQRVQRATLGMQLILNGPTIRVFSICDGTIGEVVGYQDGIVSWGDIAFDGIEGQEWELSEAVVNIKRGPFLSGDGVTNDYIGNILRGSYPIGSTVRLNMLVEDGGTIYERLIFLGRIEEYSIQQDGATFRLSQTADDGNMIPERIVDSELVVEGAREGKILESVHGKPIPFFIGRFTPTAVRTYNFANTLAGWSDAENEQDTSKTAGEQYAMLTGLRFPVIQLEPYVEKYRGAVADAAPDEMSHLLFLFGDRAVSPFLEINNQQPIDRKFFGENNYSAGQADGTPPFPTTAVEMFRHMTIGTWVDSSQRFSLFLRDVSPSIEAIHRPAWFHKAGATFADQIRPLGISAKNARLSYGILINSLLPPDSSSLEESSIWYNILQCVAIPCPSLSHTTLSGGRQTGSITDGIEYSNFNVVNPENALTPDLDTYAEVPGGARLSLQLPSSHEDLGDILTARVCCVLDAGGTCGTVGVRARWNRFDKDGLTFNYWSTESVGGVGSIASLLTGTRARRIFEWAMFPRNFFPVQLWNDPPGSQQYTVAGWTTINWTFVHNRHVGIGTDVPAAGDVAIYPTDGNTLRVVHAWMEVIYRSRMADGKLSAIRSKKVASDVITPEEAIALRARARGIYQFRPNFSAEIDTGSRGEVYIAGNGPRDFVDARYTGTVGKLIENPADITQFLLGRFLGVAGAGATSYDFGSFKRARERLDALLNPGANEQTISIMSLAQYDRETIRSVIVRIMQQARALIQPQVDPVGGVLQWRMFVEEGVSAAGTGGPASTQPERLYGITFEADMVSNAFVQPTDRSSIATEVRVEYGLFKPTGRFEYSKYVSPSATNFSTDASAYKTAMLVSKAKHSIQRQVTLKCPDIWSHSAAECLCKWVADSVREPRIGIEFDSGLEAMDLRPGHVFYLGASMDAVVPYTGIVPGASWSTHQLICTNIAYRRSEEGTIVAHVIARETFARAV